MKNCYRRGKYDYLRHYFPEVQCLKHWLKHWRIQDFPVEGAVTPKGGVPTYYLANFSRKLHENEEILGQKGSALAPPLDPPLSRYRRCGCCWVNIWSSLLLCVLCVEPHTF